MEESPFTKLDHIGVIVKDMEKAIKHYESLGIGPFWPVTNLVSVERRVMGKPIDPSSFRLRVSMARVGTVIFELIQPVEGDSLWKRFNDTHGDGINHLGFYVDDVFEEAAKLEKKGYKNIYSAVFEGGGGAVYFGTEEVGGVILELVHWPPHMQDVNNA